MGKLTDASLRTRVGKRGRLRIETLLIDEVTIVTRSRTSVKATDVQPKLFRESESKRTLNSEISGLICPKRDGPLISCSSARPSGFCRRAGFNFPVCLLASTVTTATQVSPRAKQPTFDATERREKGFDLASGYLVDPERAAQLSFALTTRTRISLRSTHSEPTKSTSAHCCSAS